MSEPHPIPTHPRFKDLTGKRFGRLIVSEFRGFAGHNGLWSCICDCGGCKEIFTSNLVRGLTKSCGCLRSKSNVERLTKHGQSNTPIYNVWKSMINRCHRPSVKCYKRYGGRGIKVCRRWRESFENFIADMGDRPNGYSIERRDNDGNYCPENCCWASKATQQANRSNSIHVAHDGQTKTVGEWVKILGITRGEALRRFGIKHKRK